MVEIQTRTDIEQRGVGLRSQAMTKPELMKKLEAIADEFERGRWWGHLEVEFKDGSANYVRKTFSEAVREDAHAQTRAPRNRY
jgi:hypothetical protein